MRLHDELLVEHHLATVYRYGAGLWGVVLLAFGALGFADRLSPFDTDGTHIAGMPTNGLLSLISVLFGLLLLTGTAVGENVSSVLNIVGGALFGLSAFVHTFILDRPANILDFGMTNLLRLRHGGARLGPRHVRPRVDKAAARQPLLAPPSPA